MAEATQIAQLRTWIAEPTQTTYTDEVLSERIDGAESLRLLASAIWDEKAASYAGLIDVKEGNSDRKLSQLLSNAQKMAIRFGQVTETGAETPVRRASRTRPIERQ